METILGAAQQAFDRVGFFRLLYGERPERTEAVPFVGSTHYFRAEGTLDCIDPAVAICGALPPFHRGFRRLPFTVVESEADIDQRQERLERALGDVGIAEEPSRRMLMITNEANGPFACDLSTGLGWEGHPASIHYWGGTEEELGFQLAAHEPDYVVWCLPQNPTGLLPFPGEQTIVAHCIDAPLPDWQGMLWLFCDEINLIGSRPPGRTAFRVDWEQLLIEAGHSGRPAITTLKHEAFPLVRYELPNAFEVLV
ncbi:hypothetical protein PDESU_05086 [Pontiella desulfatans]|uniref:Uncharacterized protein n=1 Tax=Pontiella desulfatans TaxID=2750659 RepID=A0A6C2U944_PONDE|nr:hypothetical protein [Pontiella desulfatans]VGO16495.1 hypothetical protein PDESU_05086 [Pontiella desulfatans]